jgi:hypothetical protein
MNPRAWTVFTFLALMISWSSAAPVLVKSDSNGIDGFELSYGGLFWWDTDGECQGEFPNDAAIKFTGTRSSNAPVHSIMQSCSIMLSALDNPVRDEAYAYFFVGNQLRRKSLGAATADAALIVPTPPLSPTLTADQNGAALAIHDHTLYFARYTASTGLNELYALDLEGTNAVKVGQFDSNSPVISLRYFDYPTTLQPVVHALAVLTDNGRLYRMKLNPVRGENPVLLLATGVSYFTTRTGGFELSNTYIFATKGPRAILGDATGGPSTFYRVHPDNGNETLLYTAQGDNVLIGVTTSGYDFEDNYIFLAEGIVVGGAGEFTSIADVAIRRHEASDLTGPWDSILLAGGGSNLKSDGKLLYFVRTNAIFSLPTGSPPVQLDVRAVGLEAVQVLQSFDHAVPLVANRPIYVRAYASLPINTTGQEQWFPAAELRGFLNGTELAGGPLKPLRYSPVHTVGPRGQMRADTTNTFLFELPADWTRPGSLPLNFLQFIFTVNAGLEVPETVSNPMANNTFTSNPARIVRGATPCLVMLPVYSWGPEYDAWEDPNFPLIMEKARTLVPVEDFDVHPFSIAAGDPDDPLNFQWEGSDAETQAERDDENRSYRKGQWGQANDQAEDLGSESDLCDTDDIHYIAMVHDEAVIAPPGGQGERPGNAFGIRMTGGHTTTQDPRGGRTLAHELGHNYGRRHVACGEFPEEEANFDDIPFPESLGNPDENALDATFAFDPLTFLVLRPTEACDIMGYGSTRWPTAYYWNAVLNEANSAAGFGGGIAPAAAPPPTTLLLVRGTIYTNSAAFRTFSAYPTALAPAGNVTRSRADARTAARANDPYFFRQFDGAGHLLLEAAILPRDPSYHEHEKPEWRFSQYIDFDARARLLQLTRGALVLAERFISAHAPSLRLDAPIIEAGAETMTLNWVASDVDGDPLRFTIHYSADNGARWQALKTEYRKLSIQTSTRLLAGGSSCRVRVTAHDGANSTMAVSDPFTIPRHAPAPVIHGVREGQTVPFGSPLRFRAVAFDAEEGSAHLTQRWQLTGPQTSRSANGSFFTASELPPGTFTVRFTATDSDGQSNVVSRSFEVAPVAIPDAATAPVLDGLANDAAYAGAALVPMTDRGEEATARLVHHNGFLYVSLTGLRYTTFLRGNAVAGLRFDVNASRDSRVATGDIGFFVDEDGVPFQEVPDAGNFVRTTTPALGFTAYIHRGSTRWSAEFQIADKLVGGWNHAAGIMLAHDDFLWPISSVTNRPSSWGPAWLGNVALPTTNRPPVARAGGDRTMALSFPRVLFLDGSGSYDPEGAPLTYAWTQVAGPAVIFGQTTEAISHFTAPTVSTPTTFRFQLIVHDGAKASAPDEVIITVLPKLAVPLVVKPTGFATLRPDGKMQVRLVGNPGVTYRIQTSPDLISWSNYRTVTGDFNGAIEFTVDPAAFPEPARFFRAVSP